MNKTNEHLVLTHQTIEMKNLINENFKRSNMQNVHVQSCAFNTCNFSRSNLTNLRIADSTFNNCQFINVDLSFCKFSNCTFKDCDFSLAEIENINCYRGGFQNVKFVGSRLANNTFKETIFTNVDLNGSSTKFNCFEDSIWKDSVFGNCTIDYNISTNCKYENTEINLEVLGSTWGIQEENFEKVTILSLGRKIKENQKEIYQRYEQYLLEKKLDLELFTFHVSFKKENIYSNLEKLLDNLEKRYSREQYLSPDELHYFYEILKIMRKNSSLPLLILKEILMFFKNILNSISNEDSYYETMLLFYNNICLIYNSFIDELSTFQQETLSDNQLYQVKIIFKEKPKLDIVEIFQQLDHYIYGTSTNSYIKFVKDARGSYIIWLIMPLAVLAAFNIGTLLLTGGVKHLIKLRASTEVLFSKKLPRKYYLAVYNKDASEELATGILSMLLKGNISSLPPYLRSMYSSGFNSQNISEITVEKDNSAPA